MFLNSDKIVVDDLSLSASEGRPLNRLISSGLLPECRIHAELGDIISGKKNGRENEEEKILFNPMGLAIEDLIVANEIYKRAKFASVGMKFSLGNLWKGLIEKHFGFHREHTDGKIGETFIGKIQCIRKVRGDEPHRVHQR